MPKARHRILLVFATAYEAKGAKNALRQGRFPSNLEIHIVICGIGAQNFLARLKEAARTLCPDMIVLGGFCGGLRPEVRHGECFVFKSEKNVENSSNLLIHSNIVLCSKDQKANLSARHPESLIVDMETLPVRDWCSSQGLPFLAIRVVSDTLHEELPFPSELLLALGESPIHPRTFLRLCRHLLFHPQRIPALFRFARNSSKARVVLTDHIRTTLFNYS